MCIRDRRKGVEEVRLVLGLIHTLEQHKPSGNGVSYYSCIVPGRQEARLQTHRRTQEFLKLDHLVARDTGIGRLSVQVRGNKIVDDGGLEDFLEVEYVERYSQLLGHPPGVLHGTDAATGSWPSSCFRWVNQLKTDSYHIIAGTL